MWVTFNRCINVWTQHTLIIVGWHKIMREIDAILKLPIWCFISCEFFYFQLGIYKTVWAPPIKASTRHFPINLAFFLISAECKKYRKSCNIFARHVGLNALTLQFLVLSLGCFHIFPRHKFFCSLSLVQRRFVVH